MYIPCWGIPSVMQTAKGISASRASSIPAAANGGLDYIASASKVRGAGILLYSLRDEERGGRSTGLLHGVGDILEDGQVEMGLASLLGVRSSNNLGTCILPSQCLEIPKMMVLGKRESHEIDRTVFDGLLGVEAGRRKTC
jgi:hypothetical protein